MDDEITSGDQKLRLLAKIREGMEVFDQTGRRVGIVDRVHLGNIGKEIDPSTVRPPSNEAGRVPADTGFGEVLENVFDPADQIEDAVQKDLVAQGFIRIAGASPAAARYIRADQISSVTGDRITLTISQGE